MQNHFDLEAVTWDLDPSRVQRAEDIAHQLKAVIPDTSGKAAMELGCGTGLMSFYLQDHFNQVYLVDSSEGMIEVLVRKIEDQNMQHFHPVHADMFDAAERLPKVDAIYSLLTLHHIRDYKRAIRVSVDHLKPSGYLCVADLEKEDGSFHAHIPGYDLHNGFERHHIAEVMKDHGLKIIHNEICYIIESDKSGEMRQYPLFMIVGRLRS